MIRALVRSTIAAVVLAYATAVIAYWVLYHIAGLRFRTADRAAFGVLCAALPLLWAVLFFRMRRPRAPAATAFGSAQWMPPKAVRRMTEGGGLVIGREDRNGGGLLRYAGPAHLITIAPTRTGKGVGTIIPNLLTAARSVMVIDPKGENAAVTWWARSRFGPVHVLDPFEVTGLPCASCNPLDRIDPFAIDAAEDAALLADALITDPPHQVAEAHWNEEAKALLTGLILFVAAEEASERRGLATVRELLTLPVDRFERLLDRMQDSLATGGLVARAVNRYLAKRTARRPASSPPRSATPTSSIARARPP